MFSKFLKLSAVTSFNFFALTVFAGPIIGGGPAPVDRVRCLAENDSMIIADFPNRLPPLINFKMRVGDGNLQRLPGALATVFTLTSEGGVDLLVVVDENGNTILNVRQGVGVLHNELGDSPVSCSL